METYDLVPYTCPTCGETGYTLEEYVDNECHECQYGDPTPN